MDFGGRNVAFKALVGSHNYNLNTSDSDKDYKLFVIPTLDDLYFNKSFLTLIVHLGSISSDHPKFSKNSKASAIFIFQIQKYHMQAYNLHLLLIH